MRGTLLLSHCFLTPPRVLHFMNAVNLLLLTRIQNPEDMSLLYQALSGRSDAKTISPHEAASLRALTDFLSREAAPDLISLLDGFFFSYVIEHIGKEFDLLKISADGECVLNVELKSENIGEERIKKQLEQNRYYLGNAAGTIYSFTYVMETDTLYLLNEKGFLRPAGADELIRVLSRPALADFLSEGINRFFRSASYLISPIASPEKFLQGQYFLTNQQFDFRRRILEQLRLEAAPVICITGSAGTGKTLLLFDLAMQLSEKKKVLLIHSGPLRQGHLLLDRRLKNVDIRSSHEADDLIATLCAYSYLLIDEADHMEAGVMTALLSCAAQKIPVILAYDPHQLLEETGSSTDLSPDSPAISDSPETPAALLSRVCNLRLAFSGNIRINRPVFSFLRTLLHLKEHAGTPDYSCIDVLYAADSQDLAPMVSYAEGKGYEWISLKTRRQAEEIIAQEYGSVLVVMDNRFYYDDTLHLRARGDTQEPVRLLYEALSRTRDRLCLIIVGNPDLFLTILRIRLNKQ